MIYPDYTLKAQMSYRKISSPKIILYYHKKNKEWKTYLYDNSLYNKKQYIKKKYNINI
jgi:hypothetical protein